MVKNDESAVVNEDLKYSLSTIQQTNDKAKLCDNGFISPSWKLAFLRR
jgi:hypothetical protein